MHTRTHTHTHTDTHVCMHARAKKISQCCFWNVHTQTHTHTHKHTQVIIDVLPTGGRKNINHDTVSAFVYKTTMPHTLICTDGARYYNVNKGLLRRNNLRHVKCNHRRRERIKKNLRTKGGKAVGTQRCVCVCACAGASVCVCVCVSLCVCVCVCVWI
jgi:hypothetical protein